MAAELDSFTANGLRIAFRAAVAKAVAADESISLRHRRKIRRALAADSSCDDVLEAVSIGLVADGHFEATGMIDWANFDVEKFAELVKIVLQVLAAFGWI